MVAKPSLTAQPGHIRVPSPDNLLENSLNATVVPWSIPDAGCETPAPAMMDGSPKITAILQLLLEMMQNYPQLSLARVTVPE